MALVETESLVLKSYNLGEADRIVVFLTEEQGIVRGVAKGAKRLKSRFGGSLEPFTIVLLTYFHKEQLELVSIRHVELVKSYFDTASDPDFLQKFAYLADLLVSFTPPHDPNETLYRMVKTCLQTAAENGENLAGIGVYFELWLLRLGGYLPDWGKCDVCKRKFEAGETANMQMNFHLMCANCQKTKISQPIPASYREIYATAQRLSPVEFAQSTKNRNDDLNNVSQILKRIISLAIGREINGEKSLAMISQSK